MNIKPLLKTILVVAISLLPSLAISASAPTITSIGQITGMYSPGAMSMDGKGNIYVADSGSQEVFVYDKYATLKLKAKLDNQGNRIAATGRGIAVTNDGKTVYIAREDSVVKFNPATLEVVDFVKGYKMVGEIEVDYDGNVYVVDCTGMTINIYNQYGTLISSIGSYSGVADGEGAVGRFGSMSSIALLNGNRVAANEGTPVDMNGRLQIFTLDYSNYAVTGIQSALKSALGTPLLHTPKGMVADDQGRLYILEYMLSTLRVLDLNTLAPLLIYNNVGYSKGKLSYVADLLYDAENKRLFVSCDGGRIEIFGIDGGQNPVYANLPPTVPTPIEPVGNSIVTTDKPTFTYSTAVDDKDTQLVYRIGLFDGDEQVDTFDGSVAPRPLTENKTYGWAVQAIDTEGASSGWSFRAGFIVNAVNDPPTTPEITSPVNGENIDGNGVFGWLPSTDPDPNDTVTNYLIEISEYSDFSTIYDYILTTSTGVELYDFPKYANLEYDGIYYWRVKAMDTSGNASVTSEPRLFIYRTSVLSVNAPENSKVYVGGNYAYKGKFVGLAPVTLKDFPLGSLSVVVEKPGHEVYIVQTEVFEKQMTTVDVTLTAIVSTDIRGAKVVPNFIVGQDPTLFIVDYDGNNILDMVLGDSSGEVKVYRNLVVDADGNLTFDYPLTMPLPVITSPSVYFADWNNDNLKDVLVGNGEGNVIIYTNINTDTDPKFDGGSMLTINDEVYDVGINACPVVIDFNSDNKKDLVVANGAGQIFTIENIGTDDAPVFGLPVQLVATDARATIPVTSELSTADWNNDGRTDLVTSVYNGTFVLYNVGNGQFLPSRIAPFGGNAVSFANIGSTPMQEFIVADKDNALKYIDRTLHVVAPQKPTKTAK